MIRLALLMPLPLFLYCGDEGPTLLPSPGFPTLFDPKLGGGAVADIGVTLQSGGADFIVEGSVITPDGEEIRLGEVETGGGETMDFRWDGRGVDGLYIDPGERVLFRAEVFRNEESLALLEKPIHILRLGITEILFSGFEEGEFHEIMYPTTSGGPLEYYAIPSTSSQWRMTGEEGSISNLDTDSCEPRPPPEPWTDLFQPPLNDAGEVEEYSYNLPVAYTLGTRVKVGVKVEGGGTSCLDGSATPAGFPIEGIPLIVVPEGFEEVDAGGSEDGLEPSGTLTFLSTSPPSSAADKLVYDIIFGFYFDEGNGMVRMPGGVKTTHTLYTLFGPPALTDSEASPPYLPWIPVIDDALTWISGATADPSEGAAIITSGVYHDLGVTYDVYWGASYYTSGPYQNYTFNLTDFLKRANGEIVNCSDCAVILSTYANMVGADLRYNIIGWNFDLNYIIAIGTGECTETPFVGGAGSFSYHAVTSPDSALHIFDATLMLDGDGDPMHFPCDELLPANLEADFYLDTLSSSPHIDFFYNQKPRIY